MKRKNNITSVTLTCAGDHPAYEGHWHDFKFGTLTREEALIAHTRSNAYLMHKEDLLGSLEVGKLADIVVLDQDYMTIPVEEIRNLNSVLTMVDGRVVYESADFGGATAAR